MQKLIKFIFVITSLCWIHFRILTNTNYVQAASIKQIDTNLTDYPNNQIPKYEKFEISLILNETYTNPFNPDEIKIDGYFVSPSSKILVQPGFYYQNYSVSGIGNSEVYSKTGNPLWKIRFAPAEEGRYQYYIQITDTQGTTNSATYTFDVTNSNIPGFIHVSSVNPRYFSYDNGQLFYGLGLNVSWWQQESQRITFYSYYINRMSEYKANLARVWMTNSGAGDQTWILSIQDKNLGSNYNLEEAWAFDYILESARSKKVNFLLTLDDVNQFTYNWDTNLYYGGMGGPCSYQSCIFTHSEAKKYQKRVFRYLIARWGYATNILSWELFNEIDELQWSTNNWDRAAMILWHKDMAQYINTIDAHKHLVNTSTGSFKTHPDLYQALSEMAMAEIHFYYVPGCCDYAESDPLGKDAADLVRYYSYLVYQSVSNKPSFTGEWGLLNSNLDWTDYESKILTKDNIGIHLHNGIWSAFMSGMASTGLSWHWGYHKTHDILWWQHYKALANYLENMDITSLTVMKPINVYFGNLTDDRSTALVSSNNNIRAMGLKNNTTAYIWMQNKLNTWFNYINNVTFNPQSGMITIYGFNAETNYEIQWWDTYQGIQTKIENKTSLNDGSIQITINNLNSDIALKIIKTDTNFSPNPSASPQIKCWGTNNIIDGDDFVAWLRNYLGINSTFDLNNDNKINTWEFGWLNLYQNQTCVH